jgi:hypothetical protein
MRFLKNEINSFLLQSVLGGVHILYQIGILHRVRFIASFFNLQYPHVLKEERRLRVFENRMLSGVFGVKKDEVTGEWRKVHNEELHGLYPSATIVRVVKWRMRWAEHVARMGEGSCVYWVWWEILRERGHWGYPGVGGRIILGRIFRKWDVGVWTGFSWLKIETCRGHLLMR